MFGKIAMAAAVTMMFTGAALADPIEGNWKTKTGDTAAIGGCGGAFCITLKTGEFAGKSIGKMTASGGGSYEGSITNPRTARPIAAMRRCPAIRSR